MLRGNVLVTGHIHTPPPDSLLALGCAMTRDEASVLSEEKQGERVGQPCGTAFFATPGSPGRLEGQGAGLRRPPSELSLPLCPLHPDLCRRPRHLGCLLPWLLRHSLPPLARVQSFPQRSQITKRVWWRPMHHLTLGRLSVG